MKRTKTLLAFVALLVAMASCGKKVDVSLANDSIAFLPEGGNIEVALTSNGDWTASSAASWIVVTPASGKGDATIVVTAAPNSGNEAREAQVVVATKDKEALLAVRQDYSETPFLRIEPDQINCDRLGGTFDVNVYANIEWSLSELPAGITASATEGSGNATVSLTIDPLEGDASIRNVTLIFAGENIIATLEITQTAESNLDVIVNPSSLSFGYEGGSETLTVSCEGSWTAEANEEWVSLSVTSGEGNAEVLVSAAESDVFTQRSALIIFHSSVSSTTTVHVGQEAAPDPHFLTVSPTHFEFGKEGGSQTINIGCDTDWSIILDSDWASVSASEGTGDAEVLLIVEPNTMAEPRLVDFVVFSGSLDQRLSLHQEAGEEPLMASLSPDTVYVAYTGTANATITITSNTSWYLEAADWIYNIPTTVMEGDATIHLIVDQNNSPEPRYSVVRVLHNGQVLDENVVAQEAWQDLLELDMSEAEVRPEGGTFTFHITSNQSWMVACDVAWIHVAPTNGFANSDVTVTVDAMDSTRPRTGVITVKANSGRTVTLTVTQHQ